MLHACAHVKKTLNEECIEVQRVKNRCRKRDRQIKQLQTECKTTITMRTNVTATFTL